jgi:hypothetical protein
MTNENDLMAKLMAAKQIMNKHNDIGRGGMPVNINNSAPLVEEFKVPQATYNLPSEYSDNSHYGTSQTENINQPYLSEEAVNKNIHKMPQQASQDRILSSKLPDSIKQLMMEHPINQPDSPLSGGGTSISNELAEKAARLMNLKGKGNVNESQPSQQRVQQPSQIPMNGDLKEMIRDAVRDVLSENGMITESVSKTNDVFSFRVGSHIFEGKVTKIKKIK